MDLAFLSKRVGKILESVGTKMTLRRIEPTVYNPHNEEGTPSYTDYACDGVITRPKRGRKKEGSEDANSLQVLMRADTLPVEPSPGDIVIINGQEWHVAGNSPVKPANGPILHKLDVRP